MYHLPGYRGRDQGVAWAGDWLSWADLVETRQNWCRRVWAPSPQIMFPAWGHGFRSAHWGLAMHRIQRCAAMLLPTSPCRSPWAKPPPVSPLHRESIRNGGLLGPGIRQVFKTCYSLFPLALEGELGVGLGLLVTRGLALDLASEPCLAL